MGIPCCNKNCQQEGNYARREGCRRAADFGPRTEKSMFECIDRLQQEINTRCEVMECISDGFAVLECSNLIETSETELPTFVHSVVENYNHLSADGILTEIPGLKRFLKAAKVRKEECLGWTSLISFEFVAEYELFDSVPNHTLALGFFLTLCFSVASCERNFWKLKLVKNDLRSTISMTL
ncbi:hypothetical protein AVEN_185472-1 [Araneus ventricosus]|uniref:HAT C-terminal dimerisation domain-containing protein n=1 Tax=Araneus ventricosus TaxID=182803 RepID=A0A4Y2HDI8_ARAVE|nr:hypothetical protein AVEN_185472-1 [Araneus ventricosus]